MFPKNELIKIRTIFAGSSSFAKSMLESLIGANYNIVSVLTKPDPKNENLPADPVKELAVLNKIPLIQNEKIDESLIDGIKKLKPDLIVVAAYGKILPEAILEIPGFGCVNVHASLLSKWRGPSPIQNALLAGEKETGITIILMDKGIDTGDILAQKKIAIADNDTAESLKINLSREGEEFLVKTLEQWIKRKIEPQKQDEQSATSCQLIEREDGHIFWNEEAETIYNKYRAFYPWPGIFSFWKNNGSLMRIKLTKIAFQKSDPQIRHRLGEVFELGDKIGVQALKGIVIIEELQLEGKKSVSVKDFLNGYLNFIGSLLS